MGGAGSKGEALLSTVTYGDGFTMDQATELFNAYNRDTDAELSKAEALAFFTDVITKCKDAAGREGLTDAQIKQWAEFAYSAMDTNGNGKISDEEFFGKDYAMSDFDATQWAITRSVNEGKQALEDKAQEAAWEKEKAALKKTCVFAGFGCTDAELDVCMKAFEKGGCVLSFGSSHDFSQYPQGYIIALQDGTVNGFTKSMSCGWFYQSLGEQERAVVKDAAAVRAEVKRFVKNQEKEGDMYILAINMPLPLRGGDMERVWRAVQPPFPDAAK